MICVLGAGVSGAAAARLLAGRGERVVVLEGGDGERQRAVAAGLAAAGVEVRFGEPSELPEGTSLVVATGWPPHHPLLVAAAGAGVEVIGEVELAWRLRPEGAAPWLALTGTNGKTTAVRMLTSMLAAAGHKALAVGNVGVPVVEAVAGPYDVLAVELSSFQLHRAPTVAPRAAAVLNVAPDHLDWHGSMEEYARAKGEIFARAGTVVYNADDEWSARLAAPYPGAVGFTLRTPAPGQLGVVEDLLVDRAFTDDPVRTAEELASLEDVRPFAPHNVANALAAAALARAHGVPCGAVRQGLRDFVPDPHRIAHVARVAEVDYVDDSKATNPHAAAASLAAYPAIVWVAGGQLKGADVDELVRQAAPRLRGAVLLGADRERIRRALARHAENVPVVEVAGQDTGVMDRVVTEAARLATPGDTVLLAPAGASLDMFTGYPARGEAFARAVHRLAAGETGRGEG
ncbi:UDP-N-acetylmuramoyl-L-alanine--D-glutamate ligase [Planomonospora venezuelensis]|uniref:UDP-N-acetylmuramoylalanine--D-glutamate ligase n=1 Tax=Planomonospora venezuelensis TaxID=1999 RepID=A0A841D917_PLAVE|nr:UDP-N-acetylmuramoyl-L-alanine--D-glutamate ligase [Planomonospora venezuelensis]MBB5964818.1 UDP-N-acetylmuramoylalanine--D-glutamate ligase [Planomonospora venezuelensis]GIM99305.1 UDP-N-acetylmuramoylalanine--D-glutamate ligase [Planomonospora venezuelensis]